LFFGQIVEITKRRLGRLQNIANLGISQMVCYLTKV